MADGKMRARLKHETGRLHYLQPREGNKYRAENVERGIKTNKKKDLCHVMNRQISLAAPRFRAEEGVDRVKSERTRKIQLRAWRPDHQVPGPALIGGGGRQENQNKKQTETAPNPVRTQKHHKQLKEKTSNHITQNPPPPAENYRVRRRCESQLTTPARRVSSRVGWISRAKVLATLT